MSWIENIQKKQPEEKRKIILIIVTITTLILGILWIFTSRIGIRVTRDTTLFKTVQEGVKNAKDNFKKPTIPNNSQQ